MANNETMNPDLLLKYLDNEASDQEMREVLAWLEADPANRLELDRLDRALAAACENAAELCCAQTYWYKGGFDR